MSVLEPHSSAIALTIAGSDPSGGAGLQADLKVFHQFGVYGMSVVSLLTVQNTAEVSRVEVIDEDLFTAQLQTVLRDIPPQAAKTGALGSASIVRALSEAASNFEFPLVVDPAAVSTQGARLLAEDAVEILRTSLIPQAYLLTPNLAEASLLTGKEISDISEMKQAAMRLQEMGAKNVLMKGGHLHTTALDLLLTEDQQTIEYPMPRLDTPHTHGTGCALSAAITALLAGGDSLAEAVEQAKVFIQEAIRTAPGLGSGHGPTNLFAKR